MGNNLAKKAYLTDVGKALPCGYSVKKAVLCELGNEIDAFLEENPAAATEDLVHRFGTAEEIARSFETREDLEQQKKKARRRLTVSVLLCCLVVLIIVLLALFVKYVLPDWGTSYSEYVSSSGVK